MQNIEFPPTRRSRSGIKYRVVLLLVARRIGAPGFIAASLMRLLKLSLIRGIKEVNRDIQD